MLRVKKIQDKVLYFDKELNRECDTHGWGRGLRIASSLYKENLELENKLEYKDKLIQDYKIRIENLRMRLECKTPKIIRGDDLDGLGYYTEGSPVILE